ncbi:MAG: GDP-mannose 4,6-dehydratase, partial [Terracidiphilus sp.]
MQYRTAEDVVIATGETHSLRSFVECAFGAASLNWEKYVEHDPSLLRPTDIMTSYADPSKASRILNWTAEVKMHDVVSLMLEAETAGA